MNNPRENVSNALGEVGILGVLALLHDCLDVNQSQYETFPVIQRELRRCDRKIRLAVEEVEDPIDTEVREKVTEERTNAHDIVELINR
jgi:hypothetical protein